MDSEGVGQSETHMPDRDDFAKRYFAALLSLVTLLGLTLRVLASDHEFIGQWDEAYHALVARNFASNPFKPILLADLPANYDYQFWNQTRVWLHKPPMAMWMMAAAIKVGGDHEFMLRVPSILADTLLIVLIGLMACSMLGETGGILSALLWAICPSLIPLVGGQVPTDHPDLFLCFFSNLCLVVALRLDQREPASRNSPILWIALGACLGFAYLTKGIAAAPVLLALIIHVILKWVIQKSPSANWKQRFRAVGLFGAGLCVAVPWTVYSLSQFGDQLAKERSYDLRHIFEPIEGHGRWILYHFEVIAQNVTGLSSRPLGFFGLVIVLTALISGWRSRQSSRRLLATWVTVYFLAYSLAATRLRNYCLPAYPAFFILLVGLVLDDMKGHARSALFGVDRYLLGLLILVILIVCMSFQTLGYLQLVRDPRYQEKQSVVMSYSDMRYKMKKLARDPRPAIIWNAPDITNIQASYYSGKTVLPVYPTTEDIKAAEQKGFQNLIIIPVYSTERKKMEAKWREEGVNVEFVPIEMKRAF